LTFKILRVVNGRISLACRTQVSDLGSDMEHVFQYITCILCAGCYIAAKLTLRGLSVK